MSKQEKINLAEKCFSKIKELNLKISIQGFWIVLPKDSPKELFIDMASCDTKHLLKLLKETMDIPIINKNLIATAIAQLINR